MSDARRWKLPDPLGAALPGELARLGAPTDAGDLGRVWADAVGPEISRNAWPARVGRDGTLFVSTSSSVWAHELSHLEPMLLERLGPHAPPRLRFRVGRVPEPTAVARADAHEGPPVPTDEHRRRARALAAGIDDPSLRDAVARLAAHVLARGGSD